MWVYFAIVRVVFSVFRFILTVCLSWFVVIGVVAIFVVVVLSAVTIFDDAFSENYLYYYSYPQTS